MPKTDLTSKFKAKLHRPAETKDEAGSWAFVVLPKSVSDTLPRRGRTTVNGTINEQSFQATLDPDGQLSHWLKVSEALMKAAGSNFGETALLEIAPAEKEPEPQLPDDFKKALTSEPEARAVWDSTTTLARLDWIHWITTAKQLKTRRKRIDDACDMLASGKKRVCCFDPSGHYSKALSAPQVAD
jgi:hypothetical protein